MVEVLAALEGLNSTNSFPTTAKSENHATKHPGGGHSHKLACPHVILQVAQNVKEKGIDVINMVIPWLQSLRILGPISLNALPCQSHPIDYQNEHRRRYILSMVNFGSPMTQNYVTIYRHET
ncbi:hypothetical protein Fmac_008273 [Flemingia macrophylla]|uniref:Uncharacterized protein n=1 Tax=Flemingia macrophylla TaxID=520843 RepID=A0ABD1MWZ3_9FABA